MKTKSTILTGLLILLISAFSSCSQKTESKEEILAVIGNKTISVNEFIRRAEFTLRPAYCKNSTNIDKKIILNSLIAEKMMAIEATENNDFMNKKHVQDYLQGRKEQAMRQVLYNEEIYSKAKIDSSIIDKYYENVGRDYNISWITIPDVPVTADIIEQIRHNDVSYDTLLKVLNIDTPENRKVSWGIKENFAIIDSLYSKSYKKGDVVGPIEIKDLGYTYLKINSWTETRSITKSAQDQRFNKIINILEKRQSEALYEDYVRKIMDGVDVEFNKTIFFNLADIFGPAYLKTHKETEDVLTQAFWDVDDKENINPNGISIKDIMDKELMSIDGEVWTVEQFLQEIRIHPLVFRKKKMKNEAFGFQLQMAIMDLVRDKYLTEIAYERKMDNCPEVIRSTNMWKDYLNSLHYKYDLLQTAGLDSSFASDPSHVADSFLKTYVDTLQSKYSDRIQLNTKVFNSLKLSRIDMVANYTGLPYAQVVPTFPVITTDHHLDYGVAFK